MDVKEVRYVDYIKSKFPQMEIKKIEYNFFDGKHNDIVIINDEHVFKFAKYDWSVAFLENEVNVVNFVIEYVNMPLPHFEHLEKGIAKSNFIHGVPLFRNEILLLDGKIQDYIAMQIAIFLKQLHSIPLKNVKSRNIEEFSGALSRDGWISLYEEIKRKVFPYCRSYSKEYIDQIFKPLLENENFLEFQPALIHGDLTPYHFFFVRGKNRINGIIDFGVAGIGDPAYDIGIILDNLGEAFIKRMSRYYSFSALIDRARFYAFVNNVYWTKEVADMITTRDFTYFQFNAKERDIMPIGSKWQNMI